MRTKAFSSLVSAASVGDTSWMKNLDFVVIIIIIIIIIVIIVIVIDIIIVMVTCPMIEAVCR